MNNYKKWLGFILLMSLVMMACAIGGQGAAEVAEEAEATTEAVEQAAETEVEEAEKAVEEAEAEAEAEVEQAEEAVTKETEEEAEPEEDTTETESAAVTAGEGEKAPLEVQSIQGSLETLSSYRAQFKMTFEGTSSQGDADSGTIDMMIEAIKDPEALHMSMNIESPSMAELGGSATVELYNVDGTTYMQNPEDGSWLSFPSSGETDNIFSQGFFAPDELVELPENATRDPEPQEINGISAWHYTFDETDLTDVEESMDIESANGEIWVAEEAGYPVKMIIDVTGTSKEASPDDMFESGTFHMEYELLDVNASFEITPPEDALNAESMGGFDTGSMDPSEIEWPLMADAEVDFAMEGLVSYLSSSTIEDVVEFYKAELPDQGWTADDSSEFVSEDTAMLSFTKDEETLSLIISNDEGGKVSVVMSTAE